MAILLQVVTDQEGRPEAFKSFLERAKTGLVATWQSLVQLQGGQLVEFADRDQKFVG